MTWTRLHDDAQQVEHDAEGQDAEDKRHDLHVLAQQPCHDEHRHERQQVGQDLVEYRLQLKCYLVGHVEHQRGGDADHRARHGTDNHHAEDACAERDLLDDAVLGHGVEDAMSQLIAFLGKDIADRPMRDVEDEQEEDFDETLSTEDSMIKDFSEMFDNEQDEQKQ